MKELRLLKPNEIDARVGTISDKGASLLLYKDARVDMNILDEAYPGTWKRSHELINGNLFCTISVWNEDLKDWITRQDVGVESNTEKTKGQASDAFKRAGFNFGIGRELYTAPFIWINANDINIISAGKDNYGKEKIKTFDKFEVVTIGYDENKEINALTIKNTKTGRIVYTLGQKVHATKEVRDRTAEEAQGPQKMGQTEEERLKVAKEDIKKQMIEQGYDRADTMRTFIKRVLQKETIDNIDDALNVADALDNEA